MLMNASDIKEGDVIQFGWNHFFESPSGIMSIQSTVLLKDGTLQVPLPIRSNGKEKAVFMDLEEFVYLFEDYALDEVIPIAKVEGPVQIPMYFSAREG